MKLLCVFILYLLYKFLELNPFDKLNPNLNFIKIGFPSCNLNPLGIQGIWENRGANNRACDRLKTAGASSRGVWSPAPT